ncbi:MAG TPA: SLATT domain-containing protein [Pirellulales bacterium]|nr:SLATT domain-containing protein [Pirellulales bacterium]
MVKDQAGFDWSRLGYILLVIAGGCVAVDRFFGFSSAWIRYITSAMKLEQLKLQFQGDWATSTSGLDPAALSPERRTQILKQIIGFVQSVQAEVERETHEWIAEFRNSLSEVERTAQTQLEAWRPGTIQLTISPREHHRFRFDAGQTGSAAIGTLGRLIHQFRATTYDLLFGQLAGDLVPDLASQLLKVRQPPGRRQLLLMLSSQFHHQRPHTILQPAFHCLVLQRIPTSDPDTQIHPPIHNPACQTAK